MSQPALQFWFEFASTYSYLAAARLQAVAAAAGVAVEWKPFLLGPIFAAQGWNDSPFNIYPLKGRYMWRDMERGAAELGIAFRRPSRFPRGSLLAARVACISASEPWAGDFVRAVYGANFADDRDISEAPVIADILSSLGQPPAALIERAGAPESKQLLREQSDEAIRIGIFGAPSFVAGDELFWGNDRLERAVEWAQRNQV